MPKLTWRALGNLTTHNVIPNGSSFHRHSIVEFILTPYIPLPNMSKKSAVHQKKVKSAMWILQTTTGVKVPQAMILAQFLKSDVANKTVCRIIPRQHGGGGDEDIGGDSDGGAQTTINNKLKAAVATAMGTAMMTAMTTTMKTKVMAAVVATRRQCGDSSSLAAAARQRWAVWRR